MSACPECGGRAAKHGTKARRVLDLGADGSPEIGTVRVQRWRCVECGAFFSTGVDAAKPRGLATVAARDAVAAACFRSGWAAAGAEFGIDEKTARSLWAEWAEPRERGLPERVPGTVGLHVFSWAGLERALVTDVEAEAVVDVLRGAGRDDVLCWLASRRDGALVDTVVVSVHQPLREAVRAAFPRARVLVCPGHAAAAADRAFMHAFRQLRRLLGRGSGSNVREDPRVFAKRRGALSPGDREDMRGWDDSVLELWEAKEAFAAAVEGPGGSLAGAAASCLRLGCRGPAALADSWGDAFLSGAADRRLAGFGAALDAAAGRLSGRRPMVPFELLRALAVLADGPRSCRENPETGEAEEAGVPLADVPLAAAA